MKQVFIQKGKVLVENTPLPQCDHNSALVRVTHSVISVGTEITSVERSKKESLIQDVVKQPLKILKVGYLIKQKGLSGALQAIHYMQRKLGQAPASESGYSCSGIVVKVGKNILDLTPGDHVACGGVGKAVHAEVVSVPRNLMVKVPEGLSLKEAASTTIGSIALQGVRRADVRMGEYVAVIGLGLIGQITVQLLNIAGCRVFGIDLITDKLEIAQRNNLYQAINATLYDPVKEIIMRTDDKGVDTCIITASSSSDEIVQQAMEMTRKKGTVVVVGAVGLGLKRAPFYKKEIDFKISCSYGPGRYDELYEEKGVDYPYAYVRWTENRNMEEYLRLTNEGKINFSSLISRECPVEDAPKIYEELKSPENKQLGVIFTYNFDGSLINKTKHRKIEYQVKSKKTDGKIRVGVIGAGGFAKGVHLPNLKSLSKLYDIHAIASRKGFNAKQTAMQFGADYATTDYKDVLSDPKVDMVVITTRHDLHAKVAIDAAHSGKAIFLEKPMAINLQELNALEKVLIETKVPFTVGFNRRFSPCAQKTKEIIGKPLNPIMIFYRVNARHLPLDHWVHGPEGGGRIIGEACHMIDFFNFLTISRITSIDVSSIDPKTKSVISNDNFTATFKYEDGSVCTLLYTTQGSDDLDKEYIEISVDQKTIVLNNFENIKVYGVKNKDFQNNKVDKGQLQELEQFALSLTDSSDTHLIALESLLETAKASFVVQGSVRNQAVNI